jgi:hypothetical protein
MGRLASLIWDIATSLIVWSRASANEVLGRGQVDVAGDTRNDVEHCALPGHYSVIASSDELLILRRDDGGVSVGARTERPTDAVVGERGWTDGTAVARLLPTHIVEIKGTIGAGGISLGAVDLSDVCAPPPGPLPPGSGIPNTPYAVVRSGDLCQLGSTPIGNVIATSTRVKAC